MIEYRDLNYEKDIDEVIRLINRNLDPDYSKDLLLWKHYYNPFGRSISMVATENSKIVAIVFYMRYNFQNNNGEIIKTIRPLDVCTDESQRGKGLFKILLAECLKKNEDYDMLFSTPNKKSYPEFMKLKWLPLIKYKFKIGLINPLSKLESIQIKDFPKNSSDKKNINNHKYYSTATSLNFLTWRFKEDDYMIKKIFHDQHAGFLIYRIGKVNRIKCLILCDYMGDENLLNTGLKEVCKKEKLYLVYYLDNNLNKKIKFLFSLSLRPAIMIYKENNYSLHDDLLISLADLEGRL